MVTSFSPTHLISAAFTQANRLLDLSTPLGEGRLLAETLEGLDSVGSGGSCVHVSALSDDAHIALKTLLGQPVTVSLQTALGRDAPRVWHGHVTGARFEGANGGFARYRLKIEPWLAFLRERRDSYVFQDASVPDIVDSVFEDYRGQGSLAPQWRWEVKDRAIYSRRSLTIQYRETDLAFVERLLAEEGLYYWIEHEAGEGGHTVVIADHNGAFVAGPQASVRFHRADATEPGDTVQQWQRSKRWQTNAVRLASWDYRSRQARPVSAQGDAGVFPNGLTLADDDYPGQYAFETTAHGERLAQHALAAVRVQDEQFNARGTVRTLAPGRIFDLVDHWAHTGDDARFVVLSVRHSARNNFDEQLGQAIEQAWGAAEQARPAEFYVNHFTAIASKVEYRPATRDGHGVRVHPRPTIVGSQSALVVGEDDPVHTDRDHRVKIQFHWQRGESSSSRQAHPAGADNAPARAGLGAWVRVAEPVAGSDWGGHFVPRLGQEVVVQFLHGDVDRPVVVGALYNGAGAQDAGHNTVQAGAARATGNAPAWFAGANDAHAHNAVMSGFKTQALASSAQGTGGYNQLLMDDTPGQSRLSAATTQADSRLNLGHLKQQNDNERRDDLGHGAELATREALTLRAGAGLLISADLRADAKGSLLDSKEAIKQIDASLDSVKSLLDAGAKHGATLSSSTSHQGSTAKPDEPARGTAPPVLPAQQALVDVKEVVESKASAGASSAGETDAAGASGGAGEVAAYSKPHIQVSAPMGIGQYTPADTFTVAGKTLSLVAPDVNWAAGGHQAVSVAKGIVLFAQGQAPDANRAVTGQGLRLHAASGPVRVHSQDAALSLLAEKNITLASAQASVSMTAAKKILATAGGAYVSLEGGSVNLHAPGKVELKAGAHNWAGPQSAQAAAVAPKGDYQGCQRMMESAAGSSAAVVRI